MFSFNGGLLFMKNLDNLVRTDRAFCQTLLFLAYMTILHSAFHKVVQQHISGMGGITVGLTVLLVIYFFFYWRKNSSAANLMVHFSATHSYRHMQRHRRKFSVDKPLLHVTLSQTQKKSTITKAHKSVQADPT